MTTNIIIDTIQFKRGTAASLTLANPKLLLGEPAFEKDTRRLKIGNGEDTWDNLGYITADSTGLNNLIEDTTPQLGGNLDLNGNYITGLRIGIDVQAYSSALSLVSGTNTGDQDISGIAINAANINTNTDNIAANTLAISNLATTASELPFVPNGSISATNVQDAIQEVRDEATSGGLSSIDINTSAKIRTIVTDETGTGSLVFGTSPTLVTPNLGTPSALILTNSTLLPNSAIPTNTIAVEKLQYSSRTEGEVIKINAGISSWGLITDENITDNSITISKLNTTGTASVTTYLRGDGSWATPAGGGSGDVTKVGTPVDNQLGIWTGDGIIEGDPDLTFNGSVLNITGGFTIGSGDQTATFAGNDLRFNRTLGTSYISQTGGQQLRLQTTNASAANTQRLNITGGVNTATISLDNSNVTIPNGNLTVTGNIAVSGTVDGRDIAADGAIIDGLGTASEATLIDDDTFATASSSNIASAESVKAYVDNEISSIGSTAINWQEVTSDITLTIDDVGKIFYNTSANDYIITLPTNASVAYGENIANTFVHEGTGVLKVKGDTGVTAVTNQTLTAFKPMTYVRRGINNWIGIGEFEAWTPVTFPLDGANFVVSFYAEDLGADESAVAMWPDRIGSNNAVQGTGANQPKVNVEADGKKAVDFDGVNDGLAITEVPALDFAPGDPISLVIVTGQKSWGADQMFLFKGNTSSSTTGLEYGFYASGVDQLRGNTYGAVSTYGTKTSSGVDVWIVVSNGSTAELFKNGVSVESWSVGSANISSDIWIGCRLGGSKFFSGSIRALGIANVLLDSGQLSAINSYDW
tara:strand:- start:71156 stop:73597 length:2442 start_codon:yes stop_codon:yes gene_type:complete